MKRFVLAVFTFLLLVIPSLFYDDKEIFPFVVVLWPIAAILLAILYNKWFDRILSIDERYDKKRKEKSKWNKEENMGNDNEKTEENKD